MQKIYTKLVLVLLASVFSLTASFAFADVQQNVQAITQQMDSIEKSVSQLEQTLLYPPVTRVKVFLSLSSDADFTPSSVSLRIDGHEKTYHVYEKTEVDALRLGGIQSLWEGNVSLGKREISAKFIGLNRKGEKVTGQTQLEFEKNLQGHSLELQVKAGDKTVFTVKDWGNK